MGGLKVGKFKEPGVMTLHKRLTLIVFLLAFLVTPILARENWVVYSRDEQNEPLGWVEANGIEQIQNDVWRCWCKQPSGERIEFQVDGPMKRSRVLKVIADSGEVAEPPREWIPFPTRSKMYDLLQTLRNIHFGTHRL